MDVSTFSQLLLIRYFLNLCNVGRHANKPRQWKSMLTHQGRFDLLIYATLTTEFVFCISIYIHDSALSHYSPSKKSRPETWPLELHGYGNSGLAVVIIPLLPPNVTLAAMQTNPVSGKACSPTKDGLICLYMQPLLVPQTTEFVLCISIYIHDSASSHLHVMLYIIF